MATEERAPLSRIEDSASERTLEGFGYRQELKRSLGLAALVTYRLVFISPTSPISIFGVVYNLSHGMVPLVYLAELRKSRSVLHLSYLADVEDKELADRRLQAVEQSIRDAWRAMNCCYELTIEREVLWLRGSPPKEPVERLRGAK